MGEIELIEKEDISTSMNIEALNKMGAKDFKFGVLDKITVVPPLP